MFKLILTVYHRDKILYITAGYIPATHYKPCIMGF